MLLILNPNILNNFYNEHLVRSCSFGAYKQRFIVIFLHCYNRSLKIKQNYLIVLTYERKKTEHFQNQTDKCFHR